MPLDRTETFRRRRLAELNSGRDRAELERRYGQIWNPEELASDFEILVFLAPFVIVRRKSDNKRGSLEFQHEPRFYFNWEEDQ